MRANMSQRHIVIQFAYLNSETKNPIKILAVFKIPIFVLNSAQVCSQNFIFKEMKATNCTNKTPL